MKRIEIEYLPDGSTRVEAFGYDGGSCKDATREIEERHGQIVTMDYKPSYFEGEVLCDVSKLCG
uniref:DUF2997 domain-containing protein n=1 Tax=viral metagenome TaxID=1070528 RepID=A0A6H1ZRG7_9ZZZZ